MSQFSVGAPQGQFGMDDGFVEQRTSVMAILSLIAGVPATICCWVPFLGALLGALGTGLGVAAVVFIGSSKGRLAGRGLAVGGIVTGLIGLVVNIAGIVVALTGVNYYIRMYNGPFGTALVAIDQGDYTKARTLMDPAAQTTITDADFQRYADAMHAQIGKLAPPPKGIMDIVQLVTEFAQSTKGQQNQPNSPSGRSGNDQIPMLIKGDKGIAFVFVQHNIKNNQAKQPDQFAPLNYTSLFANGQVASLVESASPFKITPAPGTPADDGSKKTGDPADAPKDSPAPSGDAPKDPPAPPKKPG